MPALSKAAGVIATSIPVIASEAKQSLSWLRPSGRRLALTKTASILGLFLLLFMRPAPAAAQVQKTELIVKVRDHASELPAEALRAAGAKTSKSMRSDSRFKLVRAGSPAQVVALQKKLAADPDIEYVEANQTAKALFWPNDPYFISGAQWNLRQVKAPAAWDIDPGAGDGVIVAVLDTGVAYEDYNDGKQAYRRMPDLSAATFVPGWDSVNEDDHPNDDNGHGTHVAGVIAQTTNNGYGAAGLAFGARIMPVKVLNKYGFGNSFDVAEGIRWAADHGAKVINLSLGFERSSLAVKEAVNYARKVKRVTLVAAAGNDGNNPRYTGGLMYPARYSAVIGVGATRYGKKRAAYSQYGSALDIMAPGGEMELGLDMNLDGYPDGIVQETIGGFYWAEGTSVAAPHVAAAAAMVIAGGVTRPAAVYRALTHSARDLGRKGFDTRYGYGFLDVAAALRWQPVN